MDKLSLYEILSFVVPGFVAIQIAEFFNSTILNYDKWFNYESKFEESLILFCSSLFVGILIHIITFKLISCKKIKWYKKLIHKTPQEISIKDEFIQKVIPFLNEDYRNTRKHDEKRPKPNEAEYNLFDYAYHYLEISEKVATAKNFQSMYYWFRNMFTICLITLPITLLFILTTFIWEFQDQAQADLYWFLIKVIALGLLLIPSANWLRKKLIEKVLWSYYVARTHKIIEK